MYQKLMTAIVIGLTLITAILYKEILHLQYVVAVLPAELVEELVEEHQINRSQLSHYYVNAQSSVDLMYAKYSSEIQQMQEDMRKRKDMLIYLWLESSDLDEKAIGDMFDPREIWCFVVEHNGSNMVNLESCIIE